MDTEQGRLKLVSAGSGDEGAAPSDAARKRAAVELIRAEENTLRRTARRYSSCEDDAQDAYQRALEILLTKAPTTDQRQLIKWMQTVTKHEALSVRKQRERILHAPVSSTEPQQDWLDLLPADGEGPADLAERHERVARYREALQTLKPRELHALTLLAQGYSYEEIGNRTGWSYTKINRNLAEGRQRFRRLFATAESGERCRELEPLMSAFCDGEASVEDSALVREHLRACGHCRATMRAYRSAPAAAAALAPTFVLSRSFAERLHDGLTSLHGRVFGSDVAADSGITQVAMSGGTRGGGAIALAKVLAVCAGAAGGAAACVATGVVPPLDLAGSHPRAQVRIEKTAEVPAALEPPAPEPVVPAPVEEVQPEPVAEEPAQQEAAPEPSVSSTPDPVPVATPAPAPAPTAEFTPEAAPAPAPAPVSSTSTSSSSSGSSGSGAGEFGP